MKLEGVGLNWILHFEFWLFVLAIHLMDLVFSIPHFIPFSTGLGVVGRYNYLVRFIFVLG